MYVAIVSLPIPRATEHIFKPLLENAQTVGRRTTHETVCAHCQVKMTENSYTTVVLFQIRRLD